MSEQLVGSKEELNEAKDELDESLAAFINIVDNKEKKDLLKMSRAQLAEYILAIKEYMVEYKKTCSREVLRDSLCTLQRSIIARTKRNPNSCVFQDGF